MTERFDEVVSRGLSGLRIGELFLFTYFFFTLREGGIFVVVFFLVRVFMFFVRGVRIGRLYRGWFVNRLGTEWLR